LGFLPWNVGIPTLECWDFLPWNVGISYLGMLEFPTLECWDSYPSMLGFPTLECWDSYPGMLGFLPWNVGISYPGMLDFLPWNVGISYHRMLDFLPWNVEEEERVELHVHDLLGEVHPITLERTNTSLYTCWICMNVHVGKELKKLNQVLNWTHSYFNNFTFNNATKWGIVNGTNTIKIIQHEMLWLRILVLCKYSLILICVDNKTITSDTYVSCNCS